jgi:hypothetical protein
MIAWVSRGTITPAAGDVEMLRLLGVAFWASPPGRPNCRARVAELNAALRDRALTERAAELEMAIATLSGKVERARASAGRAAGGGTLSLVRLVIALT